MQTKATVNAIADDGMRVERAEREVQRLRNALADLLAQQQAFGGQFPGAPPQQQMAEGVEQQLRARIAALEADNRRITSRLAAAEQALRAEKSQRASLQRALAARNAEAQREGGGEDGGGGGDARGGRAGPPSDWGNVRSTCFLSLRRIQPLNNIQHPRRPLPALPLSRRTSGTRSSPGGSRPAASQCWKVRQEIDLVW